MQQQDPRAGNEPVPKVGFIGVGTIAKALTVALSTFDDRRADIVLSPRNKVISNELAREYTNVRVAADNQDVVDVSDIVVLAVRPDMASDVLGSLRFRPGQQLLSLVATFSVDKLSGLAAPVREVSRAVPLPPVAQRRGPLAVYTQSAAIVRLLDGLGRLIRLDDESQLDLVSAATSLMGTYFGMSGAVDQWLVKHGFDQQSSREFVAELFRNLATAAVQHPSTSFEALSRDYSTPGGLNEQAWRELRLAGWDEQLQTALDLVLDRIHGSATFDTRLRAPSPIES